MQEYNCLDPNQPIDKAFLIEASAGTGKTFAIEHIVCRLILEDYFLPEILIVTFTKASTRDLRRRIHETLLFALSYVKNPTKEKSLPYLEAIEDLEDASYKLGHALALVQDASIYTIHSFCHQALHMWAFEAKIDFDLADHDLEAPNKELNTVIVDTLRSIHDPSLFSLMQLRKVMDYFTRDITRYTKYMRNLIESEPHISPSATYKETYTAFKTVVAPLERDKLLSDFTLLAPLHKKICNKEKIPHETFVLQIDAMAKGDLEYLIGATPCLISTLQEENLKRGAVIPFEKLHYPTLYQTLKEIVPPAKDVYQTLLRLAEMTIRNVKEKKIHRPDHILDTTKQALSQKGFVQGLQKDLSVAIVDEFQDTDPIQWEILSNLFANHAKHMVLVGDPKQSIYAFRGADLDTFLKAKAEVNNTYLLTTNYRSNPSLIAAVNRLFYHEDDSLFSFDNRAITYNNVSAGKALEDDTSTLTMVIAESKKALNSSWPNKEMLEEIFFPFILNEIGKHKEEGFSLSQMAILVKDRYQGARLASYLAEHALPTLVNLSETLYHTEAYFLMEAAILATKHPRDLSQIKKFLSSQALGIEIDSLKADLTHPKIAECTAHFARLGQLLQQEGKEAYFEALFNTHFTHLSLLHQVVKHKDLYCDLMQIITFFLNDNKEDIFQKIATFKLEDADTNPALRRRPMQEGAALNIMTSHMSKGLEFDIVFSLGISSQKTRASSYFFSKENELIAYNPNDPHCITTHKELDEEKMRLFYVATTRAKVHQYLFAPIEIGQKAIQLGNASAMDIYLARSLFPKAPYQELYKSIPYISKEHVETIMEKLGIETTFLEGPITPNKVSIAEENTLIAPSSFTLEHTPKRYLSFSSLATSHYKPPLPKDDSIIPPGPETGHLFHLMLEKIIEEGIYYPWQEEKMQKTVEKQVFGTLLNPFKEQVYHLIKAAFNTPLADGLTLGAIPPSHMHQELLFTFALKKSNIYMKGFADLIFLHENKYYILDWKLNRLANYTHENLEEEMQGHEYTMQAEIYTKALQTFLAARTDEPFAQIFGGSFYFFLRGKEEGVYFLSPDMNMPLLEAKL